MNATALASARGRHRLAELTELAEGLRSFVLVGSPNVTRSRAVGLAEAVLVADEPDTVDEVRQAIDEWKQQAHHARPDSTSSSNRARTRP